MLTIGPNKLTSIANKYLSDTAQKRMEIMTDEKQLEVATRFVLDELSQMHAAGQLSDGDLDEAKVSLGLN